MLYLAGIIITFFLSFILISKKNKSGADGVLAAWLLIIGAHLLLYYFIETGTFTQYPYLLGIEIPLPLVHGPFLLLYVNTLTNQREGKAYRLLHFLPVVVAYLLLARFYVMPASQKVGIYNNKGAGFENITEGIFIAILLSGIVYIFLSLLKLKRYRTRIRDQFSNIEKINLTWLRYLVSGIVVIWLVVFFGEDRFIFMSVAIFVLFIGYFGIKQVGIFTNTPRVAGDTVLLEEDMPAAVVDLPQKENSTTEDTDAEKNKYSKSGLGEDAAMHIHQRLTELMEKEKLFTDPELTLTQLAERLQVHPNHLSQVINTREQSSFYDYINKLRIGEFKQIVRLPQNKDYTLISLAYECGFNSKSTFNKHFKKVTGLSPTDYLQQLPGTTPA